ncbi:hypothetical protein D3C75_1356300 [compost metagenome]
MVRPFRFNDNLLSIWQHDRFNALPCFPNGLLNLFDVSVKSQTLGGFFSLCHQPLKVGNDEVTLPLGFFKVACL